MRLMGEQQALPGAGCAWMVFNEYQCKRLGSAITEIPKVVCDHAGEPDTRQIANRTGNSFKGD